MTTHHSQHNMDIGMSRMIRIETRLARLQEHMGMQTRISPEELHASEFNDGTSTNDRLTRIETRLFHLLDALDVDPRTGVGQHRSGH